MAHFFRYHCRKRQPGTPPPRKFMHAAHLLDLVTFAPPRTLSSSRVPLCLKRAPTARRESSDTVSGSHLSTTTASLIERARAFCLPIQCEITRPVGFSLCRPNHAHSMTPCCVPNENQGGGGVQSNVDQEMTSGQHNAHSPL